MKEIIVPSDHIAFSKDPKNRLVVTQPVCCSVVGIGKRTVGIAHLQAYGTPEGIERPTHHSMRFGPIFTPSVLKTILEDDDYGRKVYENLKEKERERSNAMAKKVLEKIRNHNDEELLEINMITNPDHLINLLVEGLVHHGEDAKDIKLEIRPGEKTNIADPGLRDALLMAARKAKKNGKVRAVVHKEPVLQLSIAAGERESRIEWTGTRVPVPKDGIPRKVRKKLTGGRRTKRLF